MTIEVKKTRKRVVKQLRNNVVLALDNSGSMGYVANAAKKVFNEWIDEIGSQATSKNQPTNVSIVYFGESATVKVKHRAVGDLDHIEFYRPCEGSTALFQGLNLSMEVLEELVQAKAFDDSFLVLVVTDGQENVDGDNYISNVTKRMKNKQGEGNYTFVFLLPPGCSKSFASRYGIPIGNVLEWDQTEEDIERAGVHMSSSIGNYYVARSAGSRSVSDFFVQADLSEVTPTLLKRKLNDASSACKVYNVVKESVIKDFVEAKTKKEYVKGTAYYQLMKTEKVQASKGILIVEKGKPEIYAGLEARDLIGLPAHQDAKVDPFNLSKYDVYIQSSSLNRILPRGTKLIVVDSIKQY